MELDFQGRDGVEGGEVPEGEDERRLETFDGERRRRRAGGWSWSWSMAGVTERGKLHGEMFARSALVSRLRERRLDEGGGGGERRDGPEEEEEVEADGAEASSSSAGVLGGGGGSATVSWRAGERGEP